MTKNCNNECSDNNKYYLNQFCFRDNIRTLSIIAMIYFTLEFLAGYWLYRKSKSKIKKINTYDAFDGPNDKTYSYLSVMIIKVVQIRLYIMAMSRALIISMILTSSSYQELMYSNKINVQTQKQGLCICEESTIGKVYKFINDFILSIGQLTGIVILFIQCFEYWAMIYIIKTQ